MGEPGSEGDALIDENGPRRALRDVFDVSDTHPVRGGKTPYLWRLKEEQQEMILNHLADTYGLDGDGASDLAAALRQIAEAMTADGLEEAMTHFLLGFTGSKADAEEIKTEIGKFLKEKLNLIMLEEKTLITNAGSQAAKFLGYEIKAQRVNDYIDTKERRGANEAIALLVPAKVIEEKCKKYMKRGKATHRNNLLQDDDFSIVQTYQQEYRGLVQYYILAQNLSWFSKLYWHMGTIFPLKLAFETKIM